MTHTFDYTAEENQDSLKSGAMQKYRLMHWLKDVLRNFFSDPANIKDARISRLLQLQDGANDDQLKALFQVGTQYSKESKKACTTPAIIVGIGETKYPMPALNSLAARATLGGITPAESGARCMTTALQVTIATESYDGTVLLGDIIETFLIVNESLLVLDNGMISSFRVQGSSAVQDIQIGAASNAKTLYQSSIGISIVGGIGWNSDTQGPVYRGLRVHKV